MIKRENGITLVMLMVTIALMAIIISTISVVSYERLKVNDFRNMVSDLELLEDKVSNYYLQYGMLPIVRNSDNTGITYTYSPLDFNKNASDNSEYYILDLNVLDSISLYYGNFGFQNINQSTDVYVINGATHTIYYVKGIELDGQMYNYITTSGSIKDNVPPSSPQIKVVSGDKNADDKYTSIVKIEITPGKDNWSGVAGTEYCINNGTWYEVDGVIEIETNGLYIIKARTFDNSINKNYSKQAELSIIVDRVIEQETPTTPDTIQKPKITIASGTKLSTGTYITDVGIKISSSDDKATGTKYSLDGGENWTEVNETSVSLTLKDDATYNIMAQSFYKDTETLLTNYSENSTSTIYRYAPTNTDWKQDRTIVYNKYSVMRVGDYINYPYDVNNDGNSSNDWRVLGVDVDNTNSNTGNLKIMSAYSIYNNMSRYTISGASKFIEPNTKKTAADTLDDLCNNTGCGNLVTTSGEFAVVTDTQGRTARSIKLIDINSVTGYNPYHAGGSNIPYGNGQIYEYGKEVIYSFDDSGKIQAEIDGNTYSSERTKFSRYSSGNSGANAWRDLTTGSDSIYNSYYEYSAKTLTDEWLRSDSNAYKMLFKQSGTNSSIGSNGYWVADLMYKAQVGFVDYCVPIVYLGSEALSARNVYNSLGQSNGTDAEVRAVVELETPGCAWNTTGSYWEMKNEQYCKNVLAK